jgi:hypothetical protein
VQGESVPDGSTSTVGEPISSAWREDLITRANELDELAASVLPDGEALQRIRGRVDVARRAATPTDESGLKLRRRLRRFVNGASFESALGNLDAAEVDLLRHAPAVAIPALPSIEAHVNRYLAKDDPRRRAVDSIARHHRDRVLHNRQPRPDEEPAGELGAEELEILLSAQHAANSQRRRDLNRLRNFRNLLLSGTLVLTAFAVALGAIGTIWPTSIPLCFFPEAVAELRVACPGNEMIIDPPVPLSQFDPDPSVVESVRDGDVWLVELLGLLGAALTAAAALRTLGGNSTPFMVPAALVLFKLPSGAVTAVIGLLLIRADFVPGLSALDSSAQILGWAVVFGIAQQLVTQIADSQAAGLIEKVKGRGAAGDRQLKGQQPA